MDSSKLDSLKQRLRDGEYVDGHEAALAIEWLEGEVAQLRARSLTTAIGQYRASIGEDGEYELRRADGTEVGVVKFYEDAHRIVRACARVLDVSGVVLVRQATDQTICVSLATPVAAGMFQNQLTRLIVEHD